MSGIGKWWAILIVIALLSSACGGSSTDTTDTSNDAQEVAESGATAGEVDAPAATQVPEPTAAVEPTAAPAPTAVPEPTATPDPTPTPEPTPVPVLAAERAGPFECANQQAMAFDDDAGLAEELEALLEPGVPGLVAATATSDGLVEIAAVGVRSVASEEPLLSSDRMHLGSDSKSMTGALLALIAQDSDLGLDTLVTDIWPQADDGWDGVALHDLLRHRGGAEDSLGRDQGDLWRSMWQASIAAHTGTTAQRAAAARDTRSQFATTLTSAPPAETVGNFAYSNAGYIMVGAALEARLGQPWEELMCEYLFKPLRMDGCGFGAPLAPAPSGHNGQADALTAVEVGSTSADNPFSLGPAGTVHCPLADWSKYLSWVLRGARGEDDMLSAEAWQLLLEPEGDYASGWGVTQRGWAPGPIFTHNGSNTMWYATAWVAPGIDRAFLVVSNAATAQAQAATDKAIGLLIERTN